MQLIIASGNIFRREFSSYILTEAGYEISEARTAEDLMAFLRSGAHAVIVLDQHLDSGEPAATLRAVRLLSEAPIIWIGDPLRSRPLMMVDPRPAEVIQWPFRGDELLASVVTLLGRNRASLTNLASRERYAESAE
jgi:DNA-binding response OmpR family regulator